MILRHPLDRPVWSALTTRQAPLALGDGRAVRLLPDHGPFAAAADASAGNLAALAAFDPGEGGIATVEPEEMPAPPGWAVTRQAALLQMVAERPLPPRPFPEAVALTEADAEEMRALALLTEPGPFYARTHRLGDFIGVKRAGRLVAMAGERMKPDGFTEVSAVCTHPDHRGNGHAGALMRLVMEKIAARGETPFLHVYPENKGAIALYETLGFAVRRPLLLTIFERA